MDGELGPFLPVDPATDGVVQRNVVLGHQGAAGGGGSQAAQANALRRGVGDERTGAAEKLDAGKLAHLIVEGDGGGGLEGFRGKLASDGRTLQVAERGAIGCHGDLFRCAGWGETKGRVCRRALHPAARKTGPPRERGRAHGTTIRAGRRRWSGPGRCRRHCAPWRRRRPSRRHLRP